jgi:hypothetical protein
MHHQYALVVAGDFASARVPSPVSGPSVVKRLGREIADRHGLDPLGDPELIAEAEGLSVVYGWTPEKHGMHYRDTIILSMRPDPLERAVCLNHERAHHWYRKLGTPTHNETDVMLLTLELSLPHWLAHRWCEAKFVPGWLLDLRMAAPPAD